MKKLFLLIAALYLPAAGASYRCVDEKGVTHIGDTEPAACANVVMYEVSRGGTILRTIEPTPTPEQLKQRAEEAEKRKDAERAASEQKRKDLALLSSFSNAREFDVARDRNIEPITGRIGVSKDRIKVVDKRVQVLEEEMEFYKAGKGKAAAKTREAPTGLVSELARLRAEKEALEKSIASNERDIEALKARFESDKKRWLDLKADPSMRNKQPEPAKAAVAGTLIPGAAGTAKCGTNVYECQAGQTYTCRRSDGYRYNVNCVVERK